MLLLYSRGGRHHPRGVLGRFSYITLFAFSKREKRTRKKNNRTCYLSSALAEHIRGRPPQIQNQPARPDGARTRPRRCAQQRNTKGGGSCLTLVQNCPTKKLLKNSPFSRGQWPIETFIDVGFDGVYQVFDTPANAGLRSMTSKHLLGVCVRATRWTVGDGSGEFSSAMGGHNGRARARALMPAETDAAATNAYNTATALATTEAARLAIKVLKATSGAFSLVGRARNLPAIVAGRRRGWPVGFSALEEADGDRSHQHRTPSRLGGAGWSRVSGRHRLF